MTTSIRDILSLALLATAVMAAGCGLINPAPNVTPNGGGATSATPVAFEAVNYDAGPVPIAPSQHLNYRIRSQAALEQFLNAVGAAATDRPKLDFTTKEVLAFYEKGGNSACSDHRLVDLKDAGSELRWVYATPDELHPGEAQPCAQVMVNEGYDLYAIARTEKPVQGFSEYK